MVRDAGELGVVVGGLVVRWIRASMRVLAIIPLAPRVISRGSAACRPKIIQQVSSPRMSSHVPEEMPVGRAVRYAVQTEGVTWSRNAAAIRAAGRGPGRRRRRSMTASVPARSVAEHEGMSAVQYRDMVK